MDHTSGNWVYAWNSYLGKREDRLWLFLSFVAGAIQFARSEGLIPAPEPTHAIAATIREALRCRETGESKVILTAMCGHGHFDLPSYGKYLQGNMVDLSFSEEKMQASLASVPQVLAWGYANEHNAAFYILQLARNTFYVVRSQIMMTGLESWNWSFGWCKKWHKSQLLEPETEL